MGQPIGTSPHGKSTYGKLSKSWLALRTMIQMMVKGAKISKVKAQKLGPLIHLVPSYGLLGYMDTGNSEGKKQGVAMECQSKRTVESEPRNVAKLFFGHKSITKV
ncbi:hypothetical protein TREES_T100006595 [Tupaia chinensis]|uniref:Uncharacterized protein n=1 Tax=Tupaia chinensis TaxID=246437 RepID=L9KQD9_TUPCH|nr:hypothetical protein TREES_T100006595 [Tupaia chinensis]